MHTHTPYTHKHTHAHTHALFLSFSLSLSLATLACTRVVIHVRKLCVNSHDFICSIYLCILPFSFVQWIHTWIRLHTLHDKTLQIFLGEYKTLQHTATYCKTLQHNATHCNTLQHTATHCSTLQHTATHCSTLEPTASHCCSNVQSWNICHLCFCKPFCTHVLLILCILLFTYIQTLTFMNSYTRAHISSIYAYTFSFV